MHAVTQLPPEQMTPEQRCREVASLLANGLARLRDTSIQKSGITGLENEFDLGFFGNQRVHTDPVNNDALES